MKIEYTYLWLNVIHSIIYYIYVFGFAWFLWIRSLCCVAFFCGPGASCLHWSAWWHISTMRWRFTTLGRRGREMQEASHCFQRSPWRMSLAWRKRLWVSGFAALNNSARCHWFTTIMQRKRQKRSRSMKKVRTQMVTVTKVRPYVPKLCDRDQSEALCAQIVWSCPKWGRMCPRTCFIYWYSSSISSHMQSYSCKCKLYGVEFRCPRSGQKNSAHTHTTVQLRQKSWKTLINWSDLIIAACGNQGIRC